MTNLAFEVLKVISRNPRITPVMIHDKLKNGLNYNALEYILRTLRETGEVKTIVRGVYVLTEKGAQTLQSSEKTQEAEA